MNPIIVFVPIFKLHVFPSALPAMACTFGQLSSRRLGLFIVDPHLLIIAQVGWFS